MKTAALSFMGRNGVAIFFALAVSSAALLSWYSTKSFETLSIPAERVINPVPAGVELLRSYEMAGALVAELWSSEEAIALKVLRNQELLEIASKDGIPALIEAARKVRLGQATDYGQVAALGFLGSLFDARRAKLIKEQEGAQIYSTRPGRFIAIGLNEKSYLVFASFSGTELDEERLLSSLKRLL